MKKIITLCLLVLLLPIGGCSKSDDPKELLIKSNGAVKVGPNAAYLQIQKDFNTRLEDSESVTVDVTLGKNSLTPFCPEVDLNFTDVQGLEAYCATGFINTG